MEGDSKVEKRDVAEWVRFLETQVTNRNSEISLLRGEVEARSAEARQLARTIETDSLRISQMTDALASAASAIERLNARVRELETQLGSTLAEKHELFSDFERAQRGCSAAQQALEEKKHEILRHRGRQFPLLLVGVVAGALCVNIARFLWPSAREPGATSQPASTESASQSLSARPLAQVATQAPAPILPATDETPVATEGWMQTLSSMRKRVWGVEESAPWDVTPRFEQNAPIVVITRSQFRDVVTKGIPASLPSRTADGILLFNVAAEHVSETELSHSLKAEGIPASPLCEPAIQEPGTARRLTVIFSNTTASLECLNRALSTPWIQHAWEEITLISLAEAPKFSASYFSERRFLSYQEWAPDWLEKATAGDEPEGIDPAVLRARRLARVSRVLTRLSDVRIQVPTAFREFRPGSEAGSVPERGPSEANVSFGNFSIIPTTLATGPLRATRLSLQTGKPYGRSVLQAIAPNARAVIINGIEQ